MNVSVTAHDIENGDPNLCGFCPIARALERQTGIPWLVHADKARPLMSAPGSYIDLPDEAILFITRYDAGEPVEPFDFEFPFAPQTAAQTV